MQSTLLNLTYEVEVEPGEKLVLPNALLETITPGRWVIMVRPAALVLHESTIRDHTAFLNSYAPEDEGLYDDAPVR